MDRWIIGLFFVLSIGYVVLLRVVWRITAEHRKIREDLDALLAAEADMKALEAPGGIFEHAPNIAISVRRPFGIS